MYFKKIKSNFSKIYTVDTRNSSGLTKFCLGIQAYLSYSR